MNARGKFGEHERSVRVTRGATSASRFSAQKLKTNGFLACKKQRRGLSVLESLFILIHGQKIARVCVQNYANSDIVQFKLRY